MSDLNTLFSGLSTSDGPPSAATPPSQTAPSSSPAEWAGRPSTQSPTDNDSAVEANHETPEHRAPPPSVSPVAPAADGRTLVAAVTGDVPARSAPEPPNEVYTEVVKHLKRTSYHGHPIYTYVNDAGEEVEVNNWTKYWQHHTGCEKPRLCPGAISDGSAGMNLFQHKMDTCVGAHVKLVDENDKITYAIIPACQTCNFSQNEHPLVYECKAVSLFDRNKFEFIGQIKLVDKNAPTGISTNYWTEITSISRQETNSTLSQSRGKSASLTVTGYANKPINVLRECTYDDPDDFLLFLSVFMLNNLTGTKKDTKRWISLKNKKFTPEIITCNRGKHALEPREKQPEYEDLKQRLKKLGISCKTHEGRGPPNRSILFERLQAAEAADQAAKAIAQAAATLSTPTAPV